MSPRADGVTSALQSLLSVSTTLGSHALRITNPSNVLRSLPISLIDESCHRRVQKNFLFQKGEATWEKVNINNNRPGKTKNYNKINDNNNR